VTENGNKSRARQPTLLQEGIIIPDAYFAKQAGIDMVHVPYRSSDDLLADLMAGRTQAFFAPPASRRASG
jgi:hypothetical protein